MSDMLRSFSGHSVISYIVRLRFVIACKFIRVSVNSRSVALAIVYLAMFEFA